MGVEPLGATSEGSGSGNSSSSSSSNQSNRCDHISVSRCPRLRFGRINVLVLVVVDDDDVIAAMNKSNNLISVHQLAVVVAVFFLKYQY